VLGPDDPELPNNGAGHLLAILLGGLGLVFMGSGSLVVATERRGLRHWRRSRLSWVEATNWL
jgi:hypothetical protein